MPTFRTWLPPATMVSVLLGCTGENRLRGYRAVLAFLDEHPRG